MENDNLDQDEMAEDLSSAKSKSKMKQAKEAQELLASGGNPYVMAAKMAVKSLKDKEGIQKASGNVLKQLWLNIPATLGCSFFGIWIWYAVRWWGDGFKKFLVRPGKEWGRSVGINARKEDKMKILAEDIQTGCSCVGCLFTIIGIGVLIYVILNPLEFVWLLGKDIASSIGSWLD